MNRVYKEKYKKEHVASFPIDEKKIGYATVASSMLQNLRTTARVIRVLPSGKADATQMNIQAAQVIIATTQKFLCVNRVVRYTNT